ncbi:AraC family transcriptional regulator ligand-binding domain-containing protein [Nocardia sp. NPDC046763]|uniref:AraC family transcriptional regulator n=1 Tax=Nocardia sp. NPDC046763 TaxID=3155256 RepID=UPI0033DA6044
MTAAINSVSWSLVSVLVDAVRAFGATEQQISRVLGRDPETVSDSMTRIAPVNISRLWGLLYLLAGPAAGVAAARRADPGRLHVWDYLIATAPTLADGLRDAARFNETICDSRIGVEVVENGSLLTVEYSNWPLEPPVDAVIKEFAIAVTARRTRERFGTIGVPVRADFSHPEPADTGYLVDALGTSNIHFARDRDSIVFPVGSATTGAVTNDAGLQQVLRSYARRLLESASLENTWLDAFREVLNSAVWAGGVGGVTLSKVAMKLGVSDRTLQRRLADHGTTWRAELAMILRDRAIILLQDRSVPVELIASQFGYRDSRVLDRFFLRWTGQSVAEFRRRLPG